MKNLIRFVLFLLGMPLIFLSSCQLPEDPEIVEKQKALAADDVEMILHFTELVKVLF